MPLYEYECDRGHSNRDEYRSVAKRRAGPSCAACGTQMKLILSATAGVVKNPAVPKQRHRTK